jgi:hypothetical protein
MIKVLPETEDSIVLRTDFSSDTAWETLCRRIQQPFEGHRAYVVFVDERENDGLSVERLIASLEARSGHSYLFIVDTETIANKEHPILVVDLFEEPGRTFRVIPRELPSVENNLSIANLDFADFADAVGPNGIFRGF